jgi:hypothetical protein
LLVPTDQESDRRKAAMKLNPGWSQTAFASLSRNHATSKSIAALEQISELFTSFPYNRLNSIFFFSLQSVVDRG